jgi:hypothetical protein
MSCLPIFDVTFRYLNLSPLESARSMLKLLNKMGIEPVISDQEPRAGDDASAARRVLPDELAYLNVSSTPRQLLKAQFNFGE